MWYHRRGPCYTLRQRPQQAAEDARTQQRRDCPDETKVGGPLHCSCLAKKIQYRNILNDLVDLTRFAEDLQEGLLKPGTGPIANTAQTVV